jgi:hypothetical protein
MIEQERFRIRSHIRRSSADAFKCPRLQAFTGASRLSPQRPHRNSARLTSSLGVGGGSIQMLVVPTALTGQNRLLMVFHAPTARTSCQNCGIGRGWATSHASRDQPSLSRPKISNTLQPVTRFSKQMTVGWAGVGCGDRSGHRDGRPLQCRRPVKRHKTLRRTDGCLFHRGTARIHPPVRLPRASSSLRITIWHTSEMYKSVLL